MQTTPCSNGERALDSLRKTKYGYVAGLISCAPVSITHRAMMIASNPCSVETLARCFLLPGGNPPSVSGRDVPRGATLPPRRPNPSFSLLAVIRTSSSNSLIPWQTSLPDQPECSVPARAGYAAFRGSERFRRSDAFHQRCLALLLHPFVGRGPIESGKP